MPVLFQVCIIAALAGIVYFLARLLMVIEESNSKLKFKGEFMYIVKADNPDVGYALSYSVTDSEGNDVPVEETSVEIVSDNPSVVSVDSENSTVHFGSPGLANVNVTVRDADSPDAEPLGSFGAQFTVTAGDPAAISGGSITFDGLTEA